MYLSVKQFSPLSVLVVAALQAGCAVATTKAELKPLEVTAQAPATGGKAKTGVPQTSAQAPGKAGKQSLNGQPNGMRLTGNGSGFFVSDAGHVLTNQHVIEDCRALRVSTPQGRFEAQILAADEQQDLAILRTSLTPPRVVEFRTEPVALGEDVMVAGYPLQDLLSGMNFTAGMVSATTGLGGDARLIQMSSPVQPGNSGGPLLDSAGHVVGVVVAKLDAIAVARASGDIPQNVNFAVKGEVARTFLRSHSVEFRETSAAPTRSRPDIAREAQEYTLLIECWQ